MQHNRWDLPTNPLLALALQDSRRQSDEVASLVLCLASEEAGYVTGYQGLFNNANIAGGP